MLSIRNVEEKLMRNRSINPKTDCWEWERTKLNDGYGIIQYGRKRFRVHRLAAYVWLGFNLDSRLYVCHECDNRKCFNPGHLYIGTQQDNMNDMIRRGRTFNLKGTSHWSSKLNEDDIKIIKYLYSIMKNRKRKYSQPKLAKIFNVCRQTISLHLKEH